MNLKDPRWGGSQFIAAMVCSALPERLEQDRRAAEQPQNTRGFSKIESLNRVGCAIRMVEVASGTITDVVAASSGRQALDVVPATLIELLKHIKASGSVTVCTTEKAAIEYLESHAIKWATLPSNKIDAWKAMWVRLTQVNSQSRLRIAAWADGPIASVLEGLKQDAAGAARAAIGIKQWEPESAELQAFTINQRMAGEG